MSIRTESLLITGATGLVGGRVLRNLLAANPYAHAYVVVRDVARWRTSAANLGVPEHRVTALRGDLMSEDLGLGGAPLRQIERSVTTVVHCAADTVFSRPLDEARAVNTAGTAHVLAIAERARTSPLFVHVSTAFVAGRHVGSIKEQDNGAGPGFVNAYEQSKYEAEQIVRNAGVPWVIVRPSIIACDGPDGAVSQFNAMHRALRLFHAGLASMMPGNDDTPVDFVTADHVARCVADLARTPGVEGRTFHVCAGDDAIRLGDLLDVAYSVWAECPAWRRKLIPRPALTDLETYRLFERTAERTGEERIRRLTRSLSHFVPQLAYAKRFDTSGTEAVLGTRPPNVVEYWPLLVRRLIDSRWSEHVRLVA
jgi:long-chain acyl-CoA synthetase